MTQEYISQAEAARLLEITSSAVADAIKRGSLKTDTIAGRRVLTKKAVEAYGAKRILTGWSLYWSKRRKTQKNLTTKNKS